MAKYFSALKMHAVSTCVKFYMPVKKTCDLNLQAKQKAMSPQMALPIPGAKLARKKLIGTDLRIEGASKV